MPRRRQGKNLLFAPVATAKAAIALGARGGDLSKGGIAMALDDLIAEMLGDIDTIWQGLSGGQLSVDQWQETQARSLLVFHTAAYMMGKGSKTLSERERRLLAGIVGNQVDYLNGFANAIDANWNGGALPPKWQARARSYAGAVKASYSRGRTLGYNLPAHPTEGSECQNNCGCVWTLTVFDEEQGNLNAWWIRGKDDSCPTCIRRAAEWAPLRIRGNEYRSVPDALDNLDVQFKVVEFDGKPIESGVIMAGKL